MNIDRTELPDADAASRYAIEEGVYRATGVGNARLANATPSPIGIGRRGRDKAYVLYPPTALLDRKELARALSALGFPVTASTLATKATRGGGPEYQPWGGRRVLYIWGDAVAWAEGRLGAVRKHTSTGRDTNTAHHHGGSEDER